MTLFALTASAPGGLVAAQSLDDGRVVRHVTLENAERLQVSHRTLHIDD
jgi:hypothetical protein